MLRSARRKESISSILLLNRDITEGCDNQAVTTMDWSPDYARDLVFTGQDLGTEEDGMTVLLGLGWSSGVDRVVVVASHRSAIPHKRFSSATPCPYIWT